jgi:uncharacterized NAD(P)/FAD-binding protein YdhS
METIEGCRAQYDLVVIGGGCSGALVTAQLLRRGFPGRIAIVEPRAELGRGLAYSTAFDGHLLNVPACGMSAFPDEPDHFLAWLRQRRWPGAAPDQFAPRRIFGEYVAAVLAESNRQSPGEGYRHIRDKVALIESNSLGVTLRLDSGATLEARAAVLAVGNPDDSPAGPAQDQRGPGWYASPWVGDALRRPRDAERIVLIGSGLTAVDAAIALSSRSETCRIVMLSRRGIIPQVHDLRFAPAPAPTFEKPVNLRRMFADLRRQIRHLREADGCWRMAVDALRPVSEQLWSNLTARDRRSFLRHLKTYWDAHRHRMAPEIRRRIDELRAEGRLEVRKGRILDHSVEPDGIRLRIARRGWEEMFTADRVIRCTGIVENYKRPRPLLRRLIESGHATVNELGIGLNTEEAGGLIGADGAASRRIFTLGPLRLGGLIETTAIPEIRVQAQALSIRLQQLLQDETAPAATAFTESLSPRMAQLPHASPESVFERTLGSL